MPLHEQNCDRNLQLFQKVDWLGVHQVEGANGCNRAVNTVSLLPTSVEGMSVSGPFVHPKPSTNNIPTAIPSFNPGAPPSPPLMTPSPPKKSRRISADSYPTPHYPLVTFNHPLTCQLDVSCHPTVITSFGGRLPWSPPTRTLPSIIQT
jgi:hypothetical protein